MRTIYIDSEFKCHVTDDGTMTAVTTDFFDEKIDSEFKCHVTDDGTMTAVTTDFFDEKCDKFIEGYRLIEEAVQSLGDAKAWKLLLYTPIGLPASTAGRR